MIEQVVLLSEEGAAVGTAPKALVHTADTPLHLAFSCYVFDAEGRVLLTRRALGKRTWPGVWTNSCCGHPGPGEDVADAVVRRAEQELRLTLTDVRPVLPGFRYRAVAPDGIVENEVCPVFFAVAAGDPDPDPDEVVEWTWMAPGDLAAVAAAAPAMLSPWAVLQLRELAALGLV